jgi:hypothetical protein
MKEWIQRNYPGLQISIGEYNFGGEAHISGALALAEALGRFGTEGIAYAFYWTFPPKNSPAYWAFRAYRNFDSHGGHFLERSLVARPAPGVSFYASRDEKGKRLVLVALNTDAEKTANAKIALDGCSKITARRKYSYGPHTDSMQDEGVKTGALDEILLPSSINVFDVSLE